MSSTKSEEILTEGYALSEMHKRIATSIVVLFIASISLFAGGWLFLALVMAVAFIMDKEWTGLTPDDSLMWKIVGIGYITLPCIAALSLRDLSLAAIIYPIAIIIATDTGAYFVGKSIGGPKLIPSISPNKTWAGLIGGMAAASIVAISLQDFVPFPSSVMGAIMLAISIAILSQAGDFFESWLKRRKGVKDSGTLLPGHGGILDRMDGYILSLPAYLLYLIVAAELAA